MSPRRRNPTTEIGADFTPGKVMPFSGLFYRGDAAERPEGRWWTTDRKHASYFGVVRSATIDPDAGWTALHIDASVDPRLVDLQGRGADAALESILSRSSADVAVVKGWEGKGYTILSTHPIEDDVITNPRRRNPLVHHGTKATFDMFTTDTVAMNHGMGYGWGVYFTSDPATALAYAGAGGHLYTVKVPRGPWLPWVGRVKSPAARRAVQKAFELLRGKGLTWGGGIPVEEFIDRHAAHGWDSSGGCVYRDLAVALDDDVGDKVSKLLRACGLVGITYLQREARLKDGTLVPEGALNFVVFDPKDIRRVLPVHL